MPRSPSRMITTPNAVNTPVTMASLSPCHERLPLSGRNGTQHGHIRWPVHHPTRTRSLGGLNLCQICAHFGAVVEGEALTLLARGVLRSPHLRSSLGRGDQGAGRGVRALAHVVNRSVVRTRDSAARLGEARRTFGRALVVLILEVIAPVAVVVLTQPERLCGCPLSGTVHGRRTLRRD